ncbi:hypothetical protein GH714_031493 [Hevea brasiliensis]|uniref:Protein kinase domain-containing protein n=1 Tax=Hevea brasiliensis TaxID=3981 RepID=A0A6A6L485_HEVBR|nr:hypothetical protein GH714_031493 [Hevea brasiliensis]
MRFSSVISIFILAILGFWTLIHAQQPYEGKATTNCSNTDNSVLGYSCSGLNRSCQAYLTFRSQPPYNSVASISTLLSSDPSQLSAINSVSETASFDTNKLVIVPVNCSCSKVSGDVSKEIYLLNKINHFNLVRLSGVCFSDGHWFLVYEYAANGPLSDWICNTNNDGKFLNWTQRVQIALDVATGLNYLHSFTSPPHVHKNIKSSNVLLDSEFRAKIANLAMARSAEGQEGEFALTRHIVGTKGYMAPEYLEHGLVSTKLDVYAFGVLMMEIVSGKEVDALYTEEDMNLSDVLTTFFLRKMDRRL